MLILERILQGSCYGKVISSFWTHSLNLQLRKVFWEWDWKGVIALFFVTSPDKHCPQTSFVCYRRDLFCSWLSSEKTIQLLSFLCCLIICNLHHTCQLLGPYIAIIIQTLNDFPLIKNLCAMCHCKRGKLLPLTTGGSPHLPLRCNTQCFISLSLGLFSCPQSSLIRDSQQVNREETLDRGFKKRVNWIVSHSKK